MSTTNWIDFRAVRAAVSMEAVLNRYSVKVYRVNKDHVRGKCPFPTHTSKESKLSFVANTIKHVWSCKSVSCVAARQARTGGNVLDFVAVMEGCSIREAAEKLIEWFEIPATNAENIPGVQKGTAQRRGTEPVPAAEQTEPRETQPAEEESGAENRPLKFTLKGVDPGHPYLAKRGITRETAEFFGAGFFPGKGTMQGRVVIPIHNAAGELIAYAGRSTDDSEPRYRLPEGFKKSLALFNLHRLGDLADTVIVVEGFFGTMWLRQCGFPNVVGLMGSLLSDEQEKVLAEFKRVILILDGDAAGREATRQVGGRLMGKTFVKAFDLSCDKQPDKLSREDLRLLLSDFV